MGFGDSMFRAFFIGEMVDAEYEKRARRRAQEKCLQYHSIC